MEKVVSALRDRLDMLCNAQYKDPEFAKIDAVKAMECYRIMRSIEIELEEGKE